MSTLAFTEAKYDSTFEVHFWCEKQQKRCASDQPCTPLPFAAKDGLIVAEACLALPIKVNVSSEDWGYQQACDGEAALLCTHPKTPLGVLGKRSG